jgi:ferric-chelate reductase (NADPH)
MPVMLNEVEQVLLGAVSDMEMSEWVFTGKAQSIQPLRKLLRARKALVSKERVKAYWAEGKSGLD